jgi:hypothetical protein
MSSAHFICKSGKGLSIVTKGSVIYRSRAWDIPVDDADRLVNGYIYFHETKAAPSYFGGKVTSYEIIEIDKAHSKRIEFTITADMQAKGASWEGRSDDMAWYSGVIES